MRNLPTTGDVIIEGLIAHGVDAVFGIPGVHTLSLYDAMARARIRHVGVRHEQGAVFMADGYARASGRPGVACLITGPGLLNAATAIGQAYSDSIPVLVLTTLNPKDGGGLSRGRLHEIGDQAASVAPITGLVRTVTRAGEVDEALAAAWRHLTCGRPRPVVLQVPVDAAAAREAAEVTARRPAARPHPAPEAIEGAARLLSSAGRPIAILGGGTVDAAKDALAFVEASGIPVLLTTAAKGVLPETHPLNLGSRLSLAETHATLRDADVILAVGTELAETDTWAERLELPGRIIRVDLDRDQLDRDQPAELAILADAGATLAALTQALATGVAAPYAIPDRIERGMRLNPLERRHMQVLDAVRAALPADGMVFTDMTQIAYTGNTWYPTDLPRTWFHPCGFGTLGYALPAAIGGRLARPDTPTVALIGDGGIQFSLAELGTAREQRLGLPILLWNNRALGQIALGMRQREIEELAVYPFTPDFTAIAAAYDCHHVRPDSADSLTSALVAASAADKPTVVEVFEDDPWLD